MYIYLSYDVGIMGILIGDIGLKVLDVVWLRLWTRYERRAIADGKG